MKILLSILSLLMIIGTLLPLLPKDNWWIRGFDFPRLQIVAIIVITLGIYLIFITEFSRYDQIMITGLFLCLLYQLYMIYPYTRLARYQVQQNQQSDKSSRISLMCSNVLMKNRNSAKLKDLIRSYDPDIILTLETDDWWINELSEFEKDYPNNVKQPQDNMYGIALYSRLPLINPTVKFLINDEIPSIYTQTKLPSGTAVALYCLHPRPPWPSGSDTSTERDVELLVAGRDIKEQKIPTIVLGDLNDVAWSKTNYLFQNISGLLDPRVGRGFYNSFHAKYPFIRFPLDHFFHSNHFRLVNFERLDNIGSDHFPVYIELSYEEDADDTQEELKADTTEEKEADEKIEEET